MKYSIIIPHYNSPETLIRCIDSIPKSNQYQIIVIDDCSDPKKVDVDKLKSEINREIEFEQLRSNSGAGAARNAGLRLAKGEWIIFADSDDYFLPSMHELCDEETLNSEADVIFFNIDSEGNYSEQGKRYYNFVSDYDSSKESIQSLKFRSWSPWAKLFRRDFVERNSLRFEQRRKGNDCYFVLNAMLKAENIDVCKSEFYHLSYSPQSLSHTNIKEWSCMYDVYDLWLWRYRFFKDNGISLWKEYNIVYLLQEVYKTFGLNKTLKVLSRSLHYHYSVIDLIISKLFK